jgi:hypothetical protein
VLDGQMTTDVPVGAVYAIDFIVDAPGDPVPSPQFAPHYERHAPEMKNFIGMEAEFAPGARPRRADGRPWRRGPDVAVMAMPLPANTWPVVTGTGPFGPTEIGGMFTVVKVHDDLSAGRLSRSRLVQVFAYSPSTNAREVNIAQAGEHVRQPKSGEPPGMEMPGRNMPGMKSGSHQGRRHKAHGGKPTGIPAET